MKPVILVVEDNERNRKLVRTILEFRGYDVSSVEYDGDGFVLRLLPYAYARTIIGPLRRDHRHRRGRRRCIL